jgi:hypothetical protein
MRAIHFAICLMTIVSTGSAFAQALPDEGANSIATDTRDLKGTYTVSINTSSDANVISPINFIGDIVFNGKGEITSGKLIEAAAPYSNVNTPTTFIDCPVSLTGTYALSSTTSGTATLTLTGPLVSASASANSGLDANGCFDVPPEITLSFKTAHSGQFIVFQTAPGKALLAFAGSAFQQ